MKALSPFWEKMRTEIIVKYQQGDPVLWEGEDIRTFLTFLREEVIKNAKLDPEKAKQCGIPFIKGRYAYEQWNLFDSSSFLKIFRYRTTRKGNASTRQQFAIGLGYASAEAFRLAKGIGSEGRVKSKDGPDELVEAIRKRYQKDRKFRVIDILGDRFHLINSLSMKEYYVEVSYISLQTVQQRESLLRKEKESYTIRKRIDQYFLSETNLNNSIINDYERILVIGNPGVGKTTYARWLCHLWAKGEIDSHRTLIYLQLNQLDFQIKKNPILKYILQYFKIPSLKHTELQQLLAQSIDQYLFILDGFDELGSKNQTALLKYLYLIDTNPHYLLFSRPYAVINHRLDIHTAIEILGFNQFSKQNYIDKVLEFNQNRFKNKKAEELWSIVNRYPLLSDLSDNPLMLSYIVLIYLLSDEMDPDLSGVDSIYHLQVLVIKCLSNYHLLKENKGKISKSDFDKTTKEGEQLAFAMEEKSLFVITDNSQIAKSNGGEDLLVELSKIGLGRYYSKAAVHQNFHFLTVSIQEFLAAEYYGSNPDTDSFWRFLTNRIHWNFCRMIIGKMVYEKNNQFIDHIWNIALEKWNKSNPNIYLLYYQLIILSELDYQSINNFISLNQLNLYFTYYKKSVIKRPSWASTLIDPLTKIFSKLDPNLIDAFIKIYIQDFEEKILMTFTDQIDYDLEIRIRDISVLGIRLKFSNSPLLLQKSIDWIKMIDAEKKKLLEFYQADELVREKHSFLENISLDIFALFEHASLRNIEQFSSSLIQLMVEQDQEEAISLELQEHLKAVLKRIETWEVLSKNLKDHLEEIRKGKLSEEVDLSNLIERAGNTITLESPLAVREELAEKLNSIYHSLWENEQLWPYEDWLEFEIIQSLIITCINTGTLQSYELLYKITSTFGSDIFIKAPFRNNISTFLENQLAYFPKQLPSEIDKPLLIEFIQFFILIGSIDQGLYFFSKHREYFFQNFQTVVFQHWDLIDEHYQLQEEEDIEERGEEEDMEDNDFTIVDGFLRYFERIVLNDLALDKKFLLKRLFNSKLYDNNFIRYRLLIRLLETNIPIYEEVYWNYFYHLINISFKTFFIIQLISNRDIYEFPSNLQKLEPIWAYLAQIFTNLPQQKLNPDLYGIFVPAISTLKVFVSNRNLLSKSEINRQMLYSIKIILGQDSLKLFITDFEFYRVDMVSYAVLSYLFLSFLDPSARNERLEQAWASERLDTDTIFSFFISTIAKEEMKDFESLMPKDMYDSLIAFHAYFSEPEG